MICFEISLARRSRVLFVTSYWFMSNLHNELQAGSIMLDQALCYPASQTPGSGNVWRRVASVHPSQISCSVIYARGQGNEYILIILNKS